MFFLEEGPPGVEEIEGEHDTGRVHLSGSRVLPEEVEELLEVSPETALPAEFLQGVRRILDETGEGFLVDLDDRDTSELLTSEPGGPGPCIMNGSGGTSLDGSGEPVSTSDVLDSSDHRVEGIGKGDDHEDHLLPPVQTSRWVNV